LTLGYRDVNLLEIVAARTLDIDEMFDILSWVHCCHTVFPVFVHAETGSIFAAKVKNDRLEAANFYNYPFFSGRCKVTELPAERFVKLMLRRNQTQGCSYKVNILDLH
jgi:hypothetical protein